MHTLANKIKTICLLLILLPLVNGCKSKAVPTNPAPLQPKIEKAAPVLQQDVKEKPIYVYQGDKFRDPFMPSGVSSSYQSNAVFDSKRVTLKAILVSAHYNTALLSQGNGISYFIKGGILFDVMGKTVEGYTAKVYENKVVLIDEDHNEHELKLKNSEKGRDSL